MNIYEVIRRPIVTEKAVGKKETEATLCFEVARTPPRPRSGSAVQKNLQGEGRRRSTVNNLGKLRRRGKFAGYRPDWKKAYVRLKAGEKMPEYTEL